jgi:hypothetical protein
MQETYHGSLPAKSDFVGDYFLTLGRLLDPNLPSHRDLSKLEATDGRWPLGQTVAVASMVSLALWALVAAIIYYVA